MWGDATCSRSKARNALLPHVPLRQGEHGEDAGGGGKGEGKIT